ncbi:MAG: permease, partial [Eubacteriales bacterium]|nr:permease [Eubacteriales bacterium]
MKQKSSALRRYSLFLILFAANLILLFTAPEIGQSAFRLTAANLTEMLSILPPIFLLLGLMDVWIPRETMMKYMGRDAGLRGGLLAFAMGSAAAGPLYAAFPVSGMLLKKGVTLSNVFI